MTFNLVEGLVSMGFGAADGSIALLGFGADSFFEVGSARALDSRALASGAACSRACMKLSSVVLAGSVLFIRGRLRLRRLSGRTGGWTLAL